MSPRIFFYCAANAHPTGGNKIIYRHVALLADAGFDAWVYHPIDGFSYPGLAHQARVHGPSTLLARQSDLFVLPEDAGPGMAGFAPGMKKLIFNQNTYYTFKHFGLDPSLVPPYCDSDVIGALVVSGDNERYLRYVFPDLACKRLTLSLNYDVFSFVPWQNKQPQIAYMTRKNRDDVAQVVKILSRRSRLADWRLVPIDGLPEQEVARIMGESKLFLAFGHPEGLSLSNLEALASGCRLIGYSGRAGRDYFRQANCLEIEFGDIIGFCEAVEKFVFDDDLTHDKHAFCAQQGADYVSKMYSNEAERCSTVMAFSYFLANF